MNQCITDSILEASNVSVLDNILIEDNNWDYQYDKSQEGHTLFPSLSEMMDLIDSDLTKESGAPTEFVVINEKTFLDLDNNKLYFHKNGTYQNSGVPTSGSTGTGGYAISNIANSSGGNAYAMGVSLANTGGGRSISANFGNGFFGTTQISSEGTNASGIGKFKYDVPNGNGNTYTALSTKGLNL